MGTFRMQEIRQEDIDAWKLMPSSLCRTESAWAYKTCSICLSDFVEGEELREVQCEGHHVFHPRCLRSWIDRSHHACPVCRGGNDAAPTRPSYAGVAEYITRRMRSTQVDASVSDANKQAADSILDSLRRQPNHSHDGINI